MEQEDAPEPAVFENAIWSYQEYKDRLERLRNFPETMGYLVDNMRVTRWAVRRACILKIKNLNIREAATTSYSNACGLTATTAPDPHQRRRPCS